MHVLELTCNVCTYGYFDKLSTRQLAFIIIIVIVSIINTIIFEKLGYQFYSEGSNGETALAAPNAIKK